MEPQALAERLRLRYGAIPAEQLARRLGVGVERAAWRTADDRVLYLAECRIDPPRITLNAHALGLVAARDGIDPARLTHLTLAHELYHILTGQPSCARGDVEQSANLFAEALLGTFDPVAATASEETANCQLPTNLHALLPRN